jgi:chemotaxis protein MotB
MQENGLRANQVVQIRGFADQQLRLPEKPEDPSNRRISIIVRYTDAPQLPDDQKKPAAKTEPGAKAASAAPAAKAGGH